MNMKKQPFLYRSHQQVDDILAKIQLIEGVCYASVEVIKGAIDKDPKSTEGGVMNPSDSSSSIAPLAPPVVSSSIQENSHA